MPTIEMQVPASVGDIVHVHDGELSGLNVLVVAWRVTRPRFLLGGEMDGELQLSLLVATYQGAERWVPARDVHGQGEATQLFLTLPFAGGDAVLVAPTRVPGEVRSWAVTGRRLETQVMYRVHLDGTPTGHEVEVDAHDLEPRPRMPRAEAQ